jgi:hypothetical protein
VVYAWDIIPFTVPETKEGEMQEVFTHLLPNLQTDSAYVLNIKVTQTSEPKFIVNLWKLK